MKKSWNGLLLLGVMVAIGACQNKKPVDAVIQAPPAAKDYRTVYFDFDQSTIREDQTDTMLSNSQVAKDGSRNVTVTGNCDERGTNEYNMALGDRRARTTKDYMINVGVDPSKVDIISFGEERPACTEQDESCWWQNRRADFVNK